MKERGRVCERREGGMQFTACRTRSTGDCSVQLSGSSRRRETHATASTGIADTTTFHTKTPRQPTPTHPPTHPLTHLELLPVVQIVLPLQPAAHVHRVVTDAAPVGSVPLVKAVQQHRFGLEGLVLGQRQVGCAHTHVRTHTKQERERDRKTERQRNERESRNEEGGKEGGEGREGGTEGRE
jgi:hypothetical protein